MLVRGSAAVVMLCVSGAAWAGDKPLYQAAPAWVVPAPAIDIAKLTDSDPMIVILDQQQRVADGQEWIYRDQAMRVVSTQVMSQIGQLALPWQPDQGDLIVHSAEILRGAERIDLLATGQRFQILQREQQLEQRQLDGTLTATLAIEGLRVGDVVRLRFSVTTRDKALQGNVQAGLQLLGDPARARFARARLSWPSGSPFKWRTYVDGLSPAVVTKDGFDSIEIPLPLAKFPELPGDAPARFQPLPLLEGSSFADWAAVSRTFAPLYKTEGLIAPGSPLAAEVAKIAAKSTDPRTRTALALRLVQDEVRYLFKAMNNGNYVPQAPAETWSLRYGDCKAKTLLLLAMLRALGVEAEAVLASSQMAEQLPRRLPSPGAFDHVIVRATIDGTSLWLDGTDNGARLADLDDTPPFRTVLPLRTDGAALMPLPLRPSARPFGDIALEMDQSAGIGLPVPYRYTLTTRGQMAEMLNAASGQANKEQLSGMVQGMVTEFVGDSMVADRSIRYDAVTGTATVTATGILGSPWGRVEGRFRYSPDKTVSQLGFAPDRARPAWKDIPVAVTQPLSTRLSVRMHLPQKGAGFTLEGDQVLPATLAGVPVTRKTVLADGWASVEDVTQGVLGEIAPADIAAARAQVALAQTRLLEIVAPEDYPARWQLVAEARRTKGFAPILAVYAQAVADDPKAALPYLNRAAFLAGVWDWKAALPDYDKAIGIEPSVDLYLARSWAHRALGQDALALADAQRALELEPSSSSAIGTVAQLRFRKGERDAALAMLAERIAAGGKEKQGYVSAHATLLGEAGRTDEAVAAMDAIVKANPGNASLLNDRCWLKGTLGVQLDTALKDCTRAIEMAEQPASIYDSRALVYYRLGRMEEAVADLDAALLIAPSQTASLYLRGVVGKRTGAKTADADLAAARLMNPRVDEDYARYGVKP
ncbi:DUF3857 domain-containing protein [Sphingomonas sp. CJ20]